METNVIYSKQTSLRLLREKLQPLPNGPVPEDIKIDLILSWDEFSGASAEGTTGTKLLGRIENLRWEHPFLHFIIERHGATVMGSTRAELHRWSVNVETAQASCTSGGWRQVKPRSPRLDVRPLVQQIVADIERGATNAVLKWYSPTRVQVVLHKVLADTRSKQTLAGRRKRLSAALHQALAQKGWSLGTTGNAAIYINAQTLPNTQK